MKNFPISKNFSKYDFYFYTYRNVQENHSHFDGNLDQSPGDKANSEPALT